MNSFPLHAPEKPELRHLAKETCESLGLKDGMTHRFMLAAFAAARVFDHKQQKYGPDNIAEFGEIGVMIRVNDKVKRRVNLWRTDQAPGDETIEDTWGDIANYALIALMCRWGLWPKVEAANVIKEKSDAQ